MKLLWVWILVLCLVAVVDAEAQRGRWSLKPSPQIGVRGGYDYDIDVWSAGGQLRWPFMRRGRIQVVPSGDVFFAEGSADWQANADVIYSPGSRGGVYYGGGVGFSSRPGDGEWAVNRLVGLRLSRHMYIEGRWTNVDSRTLFRLVVGWNMPLRRRRDSAEGIFDALMPGG